MNPGKGCLPESIAAAYGGGGGGGGAILDFIISRLDFKKGRGKGGPKQEDAYTFSVPPPCSCECTLHNRKPVPNYRTFQFSFGPLQSASSVAAARATSFSE